MSIKCTERTGAHTQYRLTYNQVDYKRFIQLRKRSLTSMGWRYHV